MARRAMYIVPGTLVRNRVILRHKFGMPRENGVFKCQCMVCEEDVHSANLRRELVHVRNGLSRFFRGVLVIIGLFRMLGTPRKGTLQVL